MLARRELQRQLLLGVPAVAGGRIVFGDFVIPERTHHPIAGRREQAETAKDVKGCPRDILRLRGDLEVAGNGIVGAGLARRRQIEGACGPRVAECLQLGSGRALRKLNTAPREDRRLQLRLRQRSHSELRREI